MTGAKDEESRRHVIACVSGLGYLVTPSQLVRWHRAGLLPRPVQRSLGRGCGTTTIYPAGTAAQAVALCQIRADERRLDRIAFRLWWDGFPVEPAVIRRQMQAFLRSMQADSQHAADDSPGHGHGAEAILSRGFGRRRMAAMMAAALRPPDDASRRAAWEMSWPPSLDQMAESIGRLAAGPIADPSSADMLANATDEDLILARERTRTLLARLTECLAPLAWLHGKGGAAFRVMDRALTSLAPADYAGLVALMVMLAPEIPDDALAALDAGSEPPVAEDLRLILAIRDQVPGAADVLTPMAIRALMRDKEAAGRYRPQIEAFLAARRPEVDAVLPSWHKRRDSGSFQP